MLGLFFCNLLLLSFLHEQYLYVIEKSKQTIKNFINQKNKKLTVAKKSAVLQIRALPHKNSIINYIKIILNFRTKHCALKSILGTLKLGHSHAIALRATAEGTTQFHNQKGCWMKLLKKLIVASILINSVSSFAESQNPCNDGFCDKPSTACRKKKTFTDKLFVKDFAKVCGDLTVKGQVNNLELDLLIDAAVPPTDEVYTQFRQLRIAQNILENIQEFFVPRDLVAPDTEIYDNAPIYGYNVETQELIPGGGPALSYNSDFEGVDIRYHGQNPAQLAITTPENMQAWHEHALSYLMQRGFPMPGIDVYPQFEGQFIFNNNTNGDGAPLYPFFGMKFQYGDESLVPIAVDFLIGSGQATYTALALYEPDLNLRENGLYYPMRIPVTSDFAEFNAKFNKEPIVYYDNLHRRITIHIPECNNTPVEVSRMQLAIECCNCNLELDFTDNIVSFDGTFNLMRRNGLNQLVSSGFDQLEYLIQASSVVGGKTVLIDHGEPFEFTQEYNFSEQGGVFTGIAIPRMNGETTQTDVYTFNLGIENANSVLGDPLILPMLEDGPNSFQAGDNPVTTIKENLGSSIYNNYYDTEEWSLEAPGLPIYVLNGKTYPEQNGDQNIVPLPEFPVDPTKILDFVVGHEYLHNTQTLQGTTQFLPTEGQAAGIEMDPRLNHGVFSFFRQNRWTQYLATIIRGDWPLTLPEIAAQNSDIPGIPTYGSSIFWRYLATQFDYNYQVMRRMSDILSNETLNPILIENNIPFVISSYGYGGQIGYNPEGSLLALDQALHELHGRNIQEVFGAFAVSLALLRNNTSIPSPYRHEYPYWLCSPTYPGYQELSPNPVYAAWWQDYQDNNVLPVDPTFPPYEGQNFVPILTEAIVEYPMKDMTMLIFEVPKGTNFIDIHVTGEWRLSVVQFNSDGTPEGEYVMNGEFINNGGQTFFDVRHFTGEGSIRLVCAHVTMPTYQGLASFCGEGDYTGTISIYPS